MKKELLKKFFFIGIASLILIVIPIIFFVANFWDSNISDDIAKWGSFGDFFGGLINTILSLSSLVILGYLTQTINNQSVEENKNVSLLLKRIDSYEILADYLPEIHKVFFDLNIYIKALDRNLSHEEKHNASVRDFEKYTMVVVDFYSIVVTFKDRYKYLYKYDFECQDYQNLCKHVLVFKEYVTNTIVALDTFEGDIPDITFENFQNFHNSLGAVLFALRKELK
jgi:hypothetical protein